MNEAMMTLISSIAVAGISALTSLGLVNWRLKEIEKKLDIHNGYAQKFNDIALDINGIKKDIEYLKERGEN